ncbi:MAG TPA: OsmC family protein [Dehalococcoidia bacterium]|nr:OsmC family protein [Dehalococcoidia bacterium]
MADAKDLKTAIERNIKALSRRPSIGRGTATTVCRIRDGTTCDIEDGQWKLVADEMPGDGGNGLGPDPGVLGRAALGSCIAMGYVMWAAVREIPLDSVEVIVEADYPGNALYGLDDTTPPGWSAMRYKAIISSPAPEEAIHDLVDFADRHSSLLGSFERAVPVTRELQITAVARK